MINIDTKCDQCSDELDRKEVICGKCIDKQKEDDKDENFHQAKEELKEVFGNTLAWLNNFASDKAGLYTCLHDFAEKDFKAWANTYGKRGEKIRGK